MYWSMATNKNILGVIWAGSKGQLIQYFHCFCVQPKAMLTYHSMALWLPYWTELWPPVVKCMLSSEDIETHWVEWKLAIEKQYTSRKRFLGLGDGRNVKNKVGMGSGNVLKDPSSPTCRAKPVLSLFFPLKSSEYWTNDKMSGRTRNIPEKSYDGIIQFPIASVGSQGKL